MELHRPHRAGEDGQVVGLAEQGKPGVHRAVFADGVHIQAHLLPGVVVPGGHGPRPLGTGAGHGVFTGPPVAHRARLAEGPAARAGGR